MISFLCDERILNFVPKLMGKSFFRRKRQPILVDLTKQDLEKEINSAINSTSLILSGGPCYAVRIGNTSFAPADLEENIIEGIENVAKHIPQGWKNIQSLYIKTTKTICLPIYCSLPKPDQVRITTSNSSRVTLEEEEEEEEVKEEMEEEGKGEEQEEQEAEEPEEIKGHEESKKLSLSATQHKRKVRVKKNKKLPPKKLTKTS